MGHVVLVIGYRLVRWTGAVETRRRFPIERELSVPHFIFFFLYSTSAPLL